jgi:hypothetical protein
MNIIEAWKLAKIGEKIKREIDEKNEFTRTKTNRPRSFINIVESFVNDSWVFADDWEIVAPEGKIKNPVPFILLKNWFCEGKDYNRFPCTGNIVAEDISWAMDVLNSKKGTKDEK